MKLKEAALVLYKNQPAVIRTIAGDKIEITTPKGACKVREKDVNLIHAGPVRSIDQVLSAVLPAGDLDEAREFFADESPSLGELAELVWGNCPPEAYWPVWQAVSTSPWFAASLPDEPVCLRAPAEAEALIRKAAAKKEEGAERSAFQERLAAARKTGTGLDIEADGKYLQDAEALALGKTDKSRTLKEAGIPETPQAAHRLLVDTGYWPSYRNPWPSRHGHTLHSSTVPVIPPDDTDERLDLTGLRAWAIDNEWSADPDDAVSIDGDTLWVHVADPASTVTPDSDADRDARSRGSTLYVPEGAARMLADNSLDFYALGLSPVSRALSFAITLTPSGAIDSVAIHRTRIRVTRLTYREATLRREESDLAPLFAIAERNIARRAASGAVSIELPEIHLSVSRNPDGRPSVSFEQVRSEPAADMVREMMLLAGEGAARFAFRNAIPFQYVSQEAPELPSEIPDGLAGEYRKRRGMKSRKVGTIPADHAGLGLGMYSQVTSPLRRYGDLVSHQQLHLFLDGKPLLDTDDMLTRIAAGDSAARECTLAERESNLHWTLVFFQEHPEWTGEAVVVEKNGTQGTILVPELAREARITVPADLALNDTFRVRAGNINIPEQSFTFIPV